MKRALLIFALLSAGVMLAFPQTVTVKSSPAEDALVQAAKDMQTEQTSFQTLLQQARSTAGTNQKQLQDKLVSLNKDLQDKLKADKKYAPMFEQILTIQKQLQDAGNELQQKFNQQTQPIQQKIATDNALIQGLIPVVKKENDLPNTTTFDAQKAIWTAAKPDVKTEPKK